MALGLTHCLTEMSTRNIFWEVNASRCVGLTTLPPSCADFLEKMGSSTSWKPEGLSRPVMGLLYLLLCDVIDNKETVLEFAVSVELTSECAIVK